MSIKDIINWIKGKRKKAVKLFYNTQMSEPDQPRAADNSLYTWQQDSKSPPQDNRKEVKPKDVLSEIFCKDDEIQVDLTNLKEKIKAIQKRRDFMKEELNLTAGDEDRALSYLEARFLYTKIKARFTWKVTTKQKVKELTDKYKLQVASLNSYQKCVPTEALDEIEKFLNVYRQVSNFKNSLIKEPIIQLIVDVGGAEHRKDPIILASSPFGDFWYVLGAWDKEVAIVDELFLR